MRFHHLQPIGIGFGLIGIGLLAGALIAGHGTNHQNPQLVVRQDAATAAVTSRSSTAATLTTRTSKPAAAKASSSRGGTVAGVRPAARQEPATVTDPTSDGSAQSLAPMAPGTTSSDVVIMTAPADTGEPGVTRAPTPPLLVSSAATTDPPGPNPRTSSPTAAPSSP